MKTPPLFRSPAGWGLLTGLAAFAVYGVTLSRSVGFIDSGELAAVAGTLGIAHPTGYPLFTLVGRLFLMLPLGVEEIVRLNLMSAVFAAAGVGLFFLVVRSVLLQVATRMRGGGQAPAAAVNAAAAGAALLLAFSETWWAQALSVEVYPLHGFLVTAVALTFLAAAFGAEQRQGLWLAFAFLLGLSFTNHMTTVLLLPGLAVLFFATQGWTTASALRAVRLLPAFFLGLSLYLYLPIRAAAGPPMLWGNPTTLERLLWHLRGKQYSVWIFSSTEATARQFAYFLQSFPAEFAYIGGAAALAGLIVLLRVHRPLAAGTIVFFVACVGYAVNYDIHDIDSYFLLAYWTTALWAGVGLYALMVRLRKLPAAVLVAGALVLPFAAAMTHAARVDESENRLVEDYTRAMFASLRPGALVLSYQWDFWVSAAYYYQLVRGERPDVAVVDKELLRRSWYFEQLGRTHPWLLRDSRAEVDAFLRELQKFEQDLPYDPAVIQGRFEAMIGSFIRRSMVSRPVYVTSEIEPEFWRGLERVPEGLALRLVADTAFVPTERPAFVWRPFGRKGRLEDVFTKFYSEAYLSRALYYMGKRGDLEEARWGVGEALRADPSSREAARAAAVLGLGGPVPR